MRVGEVPIEGERPVRSRPRLTVPLVQRNVGETRLTVSNIGKSRPCHGIVRIEFECLFEMSRRLLEVFFPPAIPEVAALQDGVVGLDVRVCGAAGAALADPEQRDLQRRRHRLCNVILHREDVGQLAVVGVRPEVKAVSNLDQLCRDPHAVALFAHAAFENRARVQLLTDRTEVARSYP